MKQVDQVLCDTCGPQPVNPLGRSYRNELARARKHARTMRHNVHVLTSDSIHYLGAEEPGGDDPAETVAVSG